MNKSFIPNAMTLGNLVCGILSIQLTMNNDFTTAGILILLGGILDRYDGTVARFLNTHSDLGKELDSLADLVTFGVAPSILAFSLYKFINLGLLGYLILIIFPIAGAYRLARYNCTEFNNVFTGIPITIAGSLLAVLEIFSTVKLIPYPIPAVLMIVLSYLMISRYQIKKK
ncbi:MAG: CDP-diacylglycerol--serine O-phosphatidyltransferase [Clostridium sp.]|uniref:CDP-diacylglycerol--serine O-phosphatidyltransferase n=1 Tax=Clostridium sp. TaxID=1506 RepID=UPI00302AE712